MDNWGREDLWQGGSWRIGVGKVVTGRPGGSTIVSE